MPVAKVNGIKINYRVEGKGQPLVLISGASSTLRLWKPQVEPFTAHFKLIRFDNRGAGKSDKPEGSYSTREMAEDTIGLMDYLGIDKAIILGTSIGGMIAQEIAINYPQRVIRLLLCSTCACQDNENGFTVENAELQGLPSLRRLRGVLYLCFNSSLRSLFQFIRTCLALNKAKVRGMKEQYDASANHNSLDRLHLIKTPTLVVVGTNDRLVRPSSSEVLATKIPQAKLVKVANGSHKMNLEMSNAFNTEVLNFLGIA